MQSKLFDSKESALGTANHSAARIRLVGRYMTASGKVGVEIRASLLSDRLMYTGAWGAGSGLTEESMRSTLQFMLARRRGFVAEVPFDGVGAAA